MRRSPRSCGVGLRLMLAGTVVLGMGSRALAQDGNNPDVLRKELNDTLAQLKSAQDRKSELATENEKLKQQIAAMQKEVDDTRRAQATWAEQTYGLRARHAAWEVFLTRNPRMRAQWEMFLELGPLVMPNDVPEVAHANVATTPTTTSTAPTTHVTTLNSATTTATTSSSAPTSAPSSTTQPLTTAPTTNEK